MTAEKLKTIFLKTHGHCHFCGDPLIFTKYACKRMNNLKGAWEADHIIQKGKGGMDSIDNCLPACIHCNRLRWHRKGLEVQELLLYGIIAKNEVKKHSEVGNTLTRLRKKRLKMNLRRRKT